jgi:hypothetical protein
VIVSSVGGWLRRRFPLAYRLARPFWRAVAKLLSKFGYQPKPSYWEARRDYNYYREVLRLARVHASSGGQVIDVGASETELLQQLDWFGRRIALDRYYVTPKPGIETITMDFMVYRPASELDLVLCLQVLEHLHEPARFARKLLGTGRTIIISVPYKWPAGSYKGHVQDPVDEAKLETWTQCKPVDVSIVADKRERLIAVYKN